MRTLPAPPSKSLLFLEARAALDFAGMLRPLLSAGVRSPVAKTESLTIVAPGFGSGDAYTLPLRRYLKQNGVIAEGWGLGTNLGGSNLPHRQEDLSPRWDFSPRAQYRGEVAVPYLIDRFYDAVLERHNATGQVISLVGWSLGGYLAREVARELPDIVDRVVTMGAPLIGGPKYTAAAAVYRRRGTDIDWIETEIDRREATASPIKQPITAIISKTDGIVDFNAVYDHKSPRVKHIEVDASHLGMGFNTKIWSYVLNALLADSSAA